MLWMPFAVMVLVITTAVLVPLWRLGWVWQASPADVVTVVSALFILYGALKCQEPFNLLVIALVYVKQRASFSAVVALHILALVALLIVLVVLGELGLLLLGLGAHGVAEH